MEERSRNTTSSKAPPRRDWSDGPDEPDHQEMSDKEWELYSTIVESIELGCDDDEVTLEIHKLIAYRGKRILRGCNPLQTALIGGLNDIVQLLIDRGADVNASGGEHGTALQLAASRGNEPIVQLLIDRGADVSTNGGLYGTALQAAAYHGSESIAQLLIDRGANVNANGGLYGTALQAAAAQNKQSIFRLLLDKGADIHNLFTLAAVEELANTYLEKKLWKEAEHLHFLAVEGNKKFNGHDHPSTLSEITRLATANLERRKLEIPEDLATNLLDDQKISPEEGAPSTLKALESQSLTHFKQGRLKEAEELELRVLELLPDDHPDVLSVMANLTLIHSKKTRIGGAFRASITPQSLRNLRTTKWKTSEFVQNKDSSGLV